jgi:hypothetical protein
VSERVRPIEFTKSFRELSKQLSKDESKVFFDLEGREIYENFVVKIGNDYGLKAWGEELGEGSYAATMTPSSTQVIGSFLNLLHGIKDEPLEETNLISTIPDTQRNKSPQPNGNGEGDGKKKLKWMQPYANVNGAGNFGRTTIVQETAVQRTTMAKKTVVTTTNDQTESCSACEAQKVMCVRNAPGEPCRFCTEKGLKCSAAPKRGSSCYRCRRRHQKCVWDVVGGDCKDCREDVKKCVLPAFPYPDD